MAAVPSAPLSADDTQGVGPRGGNETEPSAILNSSAATVEAHEDVQSILEVSMSPGSDGEEDGESINRPRDEKGSVTSAKCSPPSMERSKRKQGDAEAALGVDTHPRTHKKLKLDQDVAAEASVRRLPQDKSLLSAAIWHRIFTFTPPKTLGNLLLVNKLFNRFLEPSSSVSSQVTASLPPSAAKSLLPDVIWRTSRRAFWPFMPHPLKGKSELDMWRLACSRKCQACHKVEAENPASSPYPGLDGVAVVWPFGIRRCGSCLKDASMKEFDLMLSSSFSLAPALPFVFITDEMHLFPYVAVQGGLIPPNVQVTKIFLKSDVDKIVQEFLAVKAMGEATVEEWMKGLGERGKEDRADFSRWDRWASGGGLAKMRSRLSSEPSSPNRRAAHIWRGMSNAPAVMPTGSALESTAKSSAPMTGGQPGLLHPSNQNGGPNGYLLLPQRSQFQPRQERTLEEVTELKARRRADIERRALLLDPPLPTNIITNIPSFQAAIQLITPLDDAAWEVLKPRLVAQRANAEQEEREVGSKEGLKQEGLEATGISEEDWEAMQAPIREKLEAFADTVIRDHWGGGKKVTKDNSPRFAAHVLLSVRNSFCALATKEAASAPPSGLAPSKADALPRKLTLELMRSLFDTKIKPHTEKFRKELFLCGGCDQSVRFYGFEGVVQHYAAKHTNTLSNGSAVVYWRAEWPDQPIFQPEPQKRGPNIQPSPGASISYATGAYPQPHTVPSYTPSSYPPSTAFGVQGMYSTQPPYSTQPYTSQGAAYPQAYGPSPIEYTGSPSPYTPHAPTQAFHAMAPAAQPQAVIPMPGAYSYHFGAYQSNIQTGFPLAQALGPSQDTYRTQLDSIASFSKDMWSRVNHKEFPGGVRAYAVIYHVSSRFRAKFSESLRLAMFIDGLSNHKDMRPVRNVNGLVCRACARGLGNAASVDEDRKTFSFPQLVNHFQQKHIEPMQQQSGNELNWVADMILLPDASDLADLRKKFPGDHRRAAMVWEALSAIPDYESALHAETKPSASWGQSSEQSGPRLNEFLDNHDRYYAGSNSEKTGVWGRSDISAIPTSLSGRSADPQVASHEGLRQPSAANRLDYFYDRVERQSHHAPRIEQRMRQPSISTAGNASVNDRTHYESTQIRPYAAQGNTDPALTRSQSVQSHLEDPRTRNPDSSQVRAEHGSRPPYHMRHSDGRPQLSESEAAVIRFRDTFLQGESVEEGIRGAEEEERRREEEINAMWSVDRARTYDSPGVDPSVQSSAGQVEPPRKDGARAAVRNVATSLLHLDRNDHRANTAFESSHSTTTTLVAADPRHYRAKLEDAPPQYRHGYVDSVPQSAMTAQGRRGQNDDPRYLRPTHSHNRARSASPPVYVRYNAAQQERGPLVHLPEQISRPRQGSPAIEEAPYRAHRHEYYNAGHEEPRYRVAQECTEAYEIVQVRDSQGEYYIRRPIQVPEREAVYVSYAEARQGRLDAGVRGLARQYERYDDAYSVSMRPTVAPHPSSAAGGTFDRYAQSPPPPVRRDEILQPHPPSPVSGSDPAYYEEYDPRYPAPPPASVGAMRQVRYQ